MILLRDRLEHSPYRESQVRHVIGVAAGRERNRHHALPEARIHTNIQENLGRRPIA